MNSKIDISQLTEGLASLGVVGMLNNGKKIQLEYNASKNELKLLEIRTRKVDVINMQEGEICLIG